MPSYKWEFNIVWCLIGILLCIPLQGFSSDSFLLVSITKKVKWIFSWKWNVIRKKYAQIINSYNDQCIVLALILFIPLCFICRVNLPHSLLIVMLLCRSLWMTNNQNYRHWCVFQAFITFLVFMPMQWRAFDNFSIFLMFFSLLFNLRTTTNRGISNLFTKDVRRDQQ